MQLIEGNLEKTLKSNSSDYYRRYDVIRDHLNKEVHPDVTFGAYIEEEILLTDHGPGHIKTVIDRASKLVDVTKEERGLSCYEIYILLVAIHFHDIGNYYGRKGHEGKAGKTIDDMGILFEGGVEKRVIKEVAQAHGGYVSGDEKNKDTINELKKRELVYGEEVRLQLLAAILRFADELADDVSRADTRRLNENKLPPGCQIYHQYAYCLHSVKVQPEQEEVSLYFEIEKKELTGKYEKLDNGNVSKVYLFDEILKRSFKMHLERQYCDRFMRPLVTIRRITVNIMVRENRQDPGRPLREIGYSLEDIGYPQGSSGDIYKICEKLNNWNGEGQLTGEALKACLLEQVNE